MPIPLKSAERFVTSLSSKKIFPSVTSIIPQSILSKVDFPHPEGPSKQIKCPSGNSAEKLLTATVDPNLFVTFSNRTFISVFLSLVFNSKFY